MTQQGPDPVGEPNDDRSRIDWATTGPPPVAPFRSAGGNQVPPSVSWSGGVQPVPRFAPPALPQSVSAAFWLLLLGAALGVVVVVLGLVSPTSLQSTRNQIAVEQPGLSSAEVEAATCIALVVAGGATILFLGFGVFLIFMIRAGRNWARIVLTVFAGLDLAYFLLDIADSGSVVTFTVMLGLISILPMVLLYLATSHEYFRQCQYYRAYRNLYG